MMSDKQIVEEFLVDQKHMVIGVVLEDGLPWAVPVRVQSYESNIFEWDSKVDTLHSRAIADRRDVMLLCFRADAQIGVYMQATVNSIDERDDGYARYRAEVSRTWLNDNTFVKREVEL